jgi:hypothetical protein
MPVGNSHRGVAENSTLLLFCIDRKITHISKHCRATIPQEYMIKKSIIGLSIRRIVRGELVWCRSMANSYQRNI